MQLVNFTNIHSKGNYLSVESYLWLGIKHSHVYSLLLKSLSTALNSSFTYRSSIFLYIQIKCIQRNKEYNYTEVYSVFNWLTIKTEAIMFIVENLL